MVPCSGRRPELKSVEFSEISILVSEIPTDRFTQEGFPLKGFAYWDFESAAGRPGRALYRLWVIE